MAMHSTKWNYKWFVQVAAPFAFAVACALGFAAVTSAMEPFQSWSISIAAGLAGWAVGQRLFGVLIPEPASQIHESCAKITFAERTDKVRKLLTKNLSPVPFLEGLLDNVERFDVTELKRLMERSLHHGDMMLAMNSRDICDGSILLSETVAEYLDEQQKACVQNGVLIRRLFRVQSSGVDGFTKHLQEDPRLVRDLLESILAHVKRGFEVSIQLCHQPNAYNPQLDYVIIFQDGVPTAFITDSPANWPPDSNGRKMYAGIRTTDPIVVQALLADRFTGTATDLNDFCRKLIEHIDKTAQKPPILRTARALAVSIATAHQHTRTMWMLPAS